MWKAVYGDTNALVESIKHWGIDTVDLEDTSKSDFIPWLLKLPFMLGTVGVLYGRNEQTAGRIKAFMPINTSLGHPALRHLRFFYSQDT